MEPKNSYAHKMKAKREKDTVNTWLILKCHFGKKKSNNCLMIASEKDVEPLGNEFQTHHFVSYHTNNLTALLFHPHTWIWPRRAAAGALSAEISLLMSTKLKQILY